MTTKKATLAGIKERISEPEVNEAMPYIRVGTSYFKKIKITDRHENEIELLKKWKQDAITLDHGKKMLYVIPRYDAFVVRPSHLKYEPQVGNAYNLYAKISHEIKAGDCRKTLDFITHIFRDKEIIFLDYLTILWRNPTQILPIVSLVSEKRQTGKTTVLKWLRAVFQSNACILKNENFQTSFNSHYVTKLLIMIDENYVDLDKKKEAERIKSMATADSEFLQMKGVDSEEIDFFGKIFMTANNKEFVKIDKEEIRYMVVEVPPFEKNDPFLLDKMISEIPAFLYLLSNRPIIHPRVDRAWFDPALLQSNALEEVVKNTRQKHEILIEDFIHECLDTFETDFSEDGLVRLEMTATDILSQLQNSYKFLDAVKIRQFLKANGYKTGAVKQYTFYSLNDRQNANVAQPNYKHVRLGRTYTFEKIIEQLPDKQENSLLVASIECPY